MQPAAIGGQPAAQSFVYRVPAGADISNFKIPDEYFPYVYDEFKGPYTAILDLLTSSGLLEGLPVDGQGVFRVNAPFCASFIECSLLVPWLVQRFQGRAGVQGIRVTGVDCYSEPPWLWPQKEKWAAKNFPGVQLQLGEQDLVASEMPEAGLTLAIHPEATRGGIWNNIIAGVLRSAAKGLCVFATFFEEEAKAVVNVCNSQGVHSQVYENGYYQGRALPESPWMRYLVVVRPGRP